MSIVVESKNLLQDIINSFNAYPDCKIRYASFDAASDIYELENRIKPQKSKHNVPNNLEIICIDGATSFKSKMVKETILKVKTIISKNNHNKDSILILINDHYRELLREIIELPIIAFKHPSDGGPWSDADLEEEMLQIARENRRLAGVPSEKTDLIHQILFSFLIVFIVFLGLAALVKWSNIRIPNILIWGGYIISFLILGWQLVILIAELTNKILPKLSNIIKRRQVRRSDAFAKVLRVVLFLLPLILLTATIGIVLALTWSLFQDFAFKVLLWSIIAAITTRLGFRLSLIIDNWYINKRYANRPGYNKYGERTYFQ